MRQHIIRGPSIVNPLLQSLRHSALREVTHYIDTNTRTIYDNERLRLNTKLLQIIINLLIYLFIQ